MNKQTEALKMAKQHIIERKGGRGGAVCYVKSDEEVIKAIDEALAQPAQEYLTRAQQVIRANNSAQEPVAWVGSLNEFDMRRLLNEGYELSTALYTHPAPPIVQEPVAYDYSAVYPLTHSKTKHIIERNDFRITGFVLTSPNGEEKCISDCQAVRWISTDLFFKMIHSDSIDTHPAPSNGMDKPVFARVVPWQGLSDDEIRYHAAFNFAIKLNEVNDADIDFARAIEQALRSKNT